MGFKVDSSFLKFVTMGALATRRVQGLMRQAGLQPIELERYSCSNKIWSTKVKRLRLPDLLCVRTGLRVEVRAKSKLAIKMSDAPKKPNRRWNSGLSGGDMIAFVHIGEDANGALVPAHRAQLFWVADLAATEGQSRLSLAKSASEGAERHLEWPVIVAMRNGVVEAVDAVQMTIRPDTGRMHTYNLNGKTPYVARGEVFVAQSQFLAGIPPRKAAFPDPQVSTWNPRDLLRSELAIDRYVGVKALGVIGSATDFDAVLRIAEHDEDERVALEAGAALVRLGSEAGLQFLENAIDNPQREYLRMEAILALSELAGTPLETQCGAILAECARRAAFHGNEVRQAALWGLGKDGLRNYRELIGFLDVASDDELVHSVCAFGADAGPDVADALIAILTDNVSSRRGRTSASFILARIVPPPLSAPRLVALYNQSTGGSRNWALATLGQTPPESLRPYLTDPDLAAQLEPLHLTAPEINWTRSEQVVDMLTFVRKQTMPQ
jgi:hypothetical protein